MIRKYWMGAGAYILYFVGGIWVFLHSSLPGNP